MSAIPVSLCVQFYNQERFARAAAEAALAQTYGPLEILFSDDASTDGTWEILQAVARDYRGPHTVRLNRNPTNVGVSVHMDVVLKLMRGAILMYQGGDDLSWPERVGVMAEGFSTGGAGLAGLYSNVRFIDENDVVSETAFEVPSERRLSADGIIAEFLGAHGATFCFRREVHERFGPLGPGLVQEDVALSLRAALIGRIGFLDRPLLYYRRHRGNLTSTGIRFRDPAAYRASVHRWHAQQVALCRHHLRVIGQLAGEAPERAVELARLRDLAEATLANCQIELDLCEKGPYGRASALVRGVAAGLPAKPLLRLLVRSATPGLFLAYLRARDALIPRADKSTD
jgi:glycosyltransferase involved in cell wall biosynthesis